MKGNWPGGLETPTAAENGTAPTEGNVVDSNRPVGTRPLLCVRIAAIQLAKWLEIFERPNATLSQRGPVAKVLEAKG